MHPARFDESSSIVLIGMRGVGKTTLGLIAATSLRRAFIDADSAFQTLHGSISTYVAKNGWPAFRDAETVILKKILSEHPTGVVIACGGGVVEREENRRLLCEFRDSGKPIVHVVRDKEETVRYLVDEASNRPAWGAWGEEIRHVWARRTPFFESICTHTIVSLTAYPPPSSPQFMMKHVETAFVRLLRSIFGLASSHIPLVPGPRPAPIAGPSSGEYGGYGACESEMGRGAKGQRTSFAAFNFPDLRIISGETIRKVAGGVDAIELRVDTLVQGHSGTPPDSMRGTPAPNGSTSKGISTIPSPHFVTLCFGHLRRCSPLPIIYTVRTRKQGGAFPDPYGNADPELMEQYLALLELGLKLGAEYIDLELALPDSVLERLVSLRGAATQCIGTDHDRVGAWLWNSQELLDKYMRAVRFDVDIIKFVSTPTTFESNLELLKFRAKVDALSRDGTIPRVIPLLAINLGKGGQLSRFLNPVLTPVTHPLLPGVAAPGQITYAQTQHALFLSGLILEKTFFVPSSSVAEAFSREAHTLGLPYTFIVEDRLPMRDVEPDFGGAFLSAPNALPCSSVGHNDVVLSPARSSGWIDLIVPACTEPESYDIPPAPMDYYKHTNVRVLALAEVITQNLSPINAVGIHTSALLVGLSLKDRHEVLEALTLVGARWVFLFACEQDSIAPASETNSPVVTSPTPTLPTSFSRRESPAPSRPHTPHLPYPQHAPLVTSTLTSFSSPALYARRPPTIIISSSAAPVFPETLFASPTGGCALDLSVHGGGGKGELWKAIDMREGGKHREGWQMLGPKEVQVEVERQAFRALTGRRMN